MMRKLTKLLKVSKHLKCAQNSPGKKITNKLKWQRLPKYQKLENTHKNEVAILQNAIIGHFFL